MFYRRPVNGRVTRDRCFGVQPSKKFDPLSISNCFCWIDPNQSAITYDGSSKIQTISDLSGNNNGFSQSSDASKRSVLGTDDNGKSVIVTDNNFYYNFSTTAKGSYQTWFLVYKRISSANTATHRLFVCGEWTQFYYRNSDQKFYYYSIPGDTEAVCYTSSTNYELVTIVFDGFNINIYKNGTLQASISQFTSSLNYYANSTIFKLGYQIAGQNLACNLGEILLYSQSMNSSNRGQIESYLINKWKI